MALLITSTHNPRVRQLLDLQTTKGRQKSGLFLVEGLHLPEALLNAGIPLQEVYYEPALLQRTPLGQALLARLKYIENIPPERLIEVNKRVITALGDVETSQGIICVLALADFSLERTRARRREARRPALLILDRLADPGNVGAILRTALAADAAAVLLTAESADCFSSKTLRAAAGAHAALPIEENLSWPEIAERTRKHCSKQMRVLVADADGPARYYDQDLRSPFALIIGSEAHGPSGAALQLATHTVSIPLANKVESLNAAMAAGIILYESVRQLRAKRG
jgi:TrmH family RNA methyltransferase